METKYLNIYPLFVGMFNSSSKQNWLQNKRFIAADDELTGVNTTGKCNEDDTFPFRAGLNTCELGGTDIKSSKELLYFFSIKRVASTCFITFKSDFKCVSFISFGDIE